MMKLPIVLTTDGLSQLTAPDYLQLATLNIGPSVTQAVSSNTITFISSNIFLTSASSINLDYINGGDAGTFIIIRGQNVKLRSNGNLRLANSFEPSSNDTIVLFRTATVWVEICRSKNDNKP